MTRYLLSLATAATLALVGMCCALGYAGIEIGNLARGARIDGAAINAEVSELHKTNLLLNDPQNGIPALLADGHRTEEIAGGAITNIEKESNGWKKESDSQSQQATLAITSLNSDLGRLGELISTTNSLVQSQSSSLTNLETQIGSSSQTSFADLNQQLELVGPILQSTQQTSENISETTASMDASAHDVQSFIHRETAPARGTWNVIKSFLISFAGPMAQVATASKP